MHSLHSFIQSILSSCQLWFVFTFLQLDEITSSVVKGFYSRLSKSSRHFTAILFILHAHARRSVWSPNFVMASMAPPDFLNEVWTINTVYGSSLSRLFCFIKVYNYQMNLETNAPPVRQNVWSMCLDLHHIWPASTEGHTNTRQTIIRNKYRQAPSIHHETWICMLTAVRNFLSLTPTPPHPHIHLSNMTPLPTRKRPGSHTSSRKPDYTVPPSLFGSRIRLGLPLTIKDVCCALSSGTERPFAKSFTSRPKETRPWTTSMLCGSPCCFSGCQAGSLFPLSSECLAP